MYQSLMRPKDSQPDDRDLSPDQYIHYIQEHGKECDRIEPELNRQFLEQTLKRAAATKTPFQSSSKFILDNSTKVQSFNNSNTMRRNYSYNPSQFMPTKELKRTPPKEPLIRSNRSYIKTIYSNDSYRKEQNNENDNSQTYKINQNINKPVKIKEPIREQIIYQQPVRNEPLLRNQNMRNQEPIKYKEENFSYGDDMRKGNNRYPEPIRYEDNMRSEQPMKTQIRQSPLMRHQNLDPDPNQHNYVKTEPIRSEILQRQYKQYPLPPQNNEYSDIYVDKDQYLKSQRENNRRYLNKSVDFNNSKFQQSNNLTEKFDMRPYYTEQGMKIYPGNYQGMTFKRPINENLYDVRYPPNIDNRKEIRKDYHSISAVSHTIPDYILFDNLNSKINTLRPYYFYDDNNIQYRQYSPYRNDYDGSRFGDPTYNYYLNGPMRGDVSKDWRYPPQYYYQPNEDFIKVPRVKL